MRVISSSLSLSLSLSRPRPTQFRHPRRPNPNSPPLLLVSLSLSSPTICGALQFQFPLFKQISRPSSFATYRPRRASERANVRSRFLLPASLPRKEVKSFEDSRTRFVAQGMPLSPIEPGEEFSNLRSLRWRIDLAILPSSPLASIDDLRRAAADSRRR